jgi:hypothetical protein
MKHLVQPTANASRRKKRGKITRLTKSRSKIIMTFQSFYNVFNTVISP